MREPWWSRRLTNVLLINICCGRASRSLLRPAPSVLAGCGVAALEPSRPARPGPAPQGVAALEPDFGAGAGAGILMVSQYSLRFSRFSHPFRLSRSAWVVPERRAWMTRGHGIGDCGASASEAVARRPVAQPLPLGVLSRSEPPGAPRGCTGAELGYCQRRCSTVLPRKLAIEVLCRVVAEAQQAALLGPHAHLRPL